MNYAKIAFTDSIKALQEQYGSRSTYERVEQSRSYDGLMPQAIQFIEERNSFYVASYGENEFPYIQHRGGPKGFLKALDDQTLGFIDFSGNKQYITLGNIQTNNKVALFLIDYPTKTRLKIYAEAEVVELNDRPDLLEKLDLGDYKARPERIILYHVKAFDWNCPQHITPIYTVEEIQEAFASQQDYISKLEAEVKELRSKQAVTS